MATVYLLVMHQLGHHHIHGIEVTVRNRAFVTDEVSKVAARRLIDTMLQHLDPRQLPPERMVEVLDHIDDMLYARKQGDFSYELLCCRDIFGIEFETQDIAIELEELIGEIVN
jgi:hypothetical protein